MISPIRGTDSISSMRCALAGIAVDLALLRLGWALKRFDPNQPRVPAGNPDGGRWTGEGNEGTPGSQYVQLRPRTLPSGYTRINGRYYPVTAAQEASLSFTAAQARALVNEVRRRDPNWQPRPSLYEGVEGQILANRADAQQAAARLRELGAQELIPPRFSDILRPGGQWIGERERRASPGTRTVTRSKFQSLLESMSLGAQEVPSPQAYRGLWYRRSDQSIFGLRRSEDHGITFDVIQTNHRSIRDGNKVHKK